MPLNFTNKLITQVELLGAAQFSKRILGIGKSYAGLEQQAKRTAERVGEMNARVTVDQAKVASQAKSYAASQVRSAASTERLAKAETNLNRAVAKRDAIRGVAAKQKHGIEDTRSAIQQRMMDREKAREVLKEAKDNWQRNKQLFGNFLKTQGWTESDYNKIDPVFKQALDKQFKTAQPGHHRAYVDAQENLRLAARIATPAVASADTDIAALRRLEAQQKQDLRKTNTVLASSGHGVAASSKQEADARRENQRILREEARQKSQLEMVNRRLAASQKAASMASRRAQEAINELQDAKRAQFGNLMAGIGVAAVSTFGALAKSVFDVTSEFETLQLQLEFLFKDAAKGKEAFAWAQQFAAKTPFDVQGVIGGFRDLAAYGIQPTEKRMRALGGAASLFGKDFSIIARSVGQALSGQFGRISRNLPITRKSLQEYANKAGFGKLFDGKNQVISRKNLESALLGDGKRVGYFEAKWGESMKKMENSTKVLTANVADAWKNLLFRFGEEPNSGLKDWLKSITATLDNIDGAKIVQISAGFKLMAASLAGVGMVATAVFSVVALGLGNIVSMVGRLVEAIGWLTRQKGIQQFGADMKNMAHGPALAFGAAAAGLGKIGLDLANSYNQDMEKLKDPSNFTKKKPTIPPLPGTGQEGDATGASVLSNTIQQILGGTKLAALLPKATELPDIAGKNKNAPIRVQLAGSAFSTIEAAMEEIVNRILQEGHQHGAFEIRPVGGGG